MTEQTGGPRAARRRFVAAAVTAATIALGVAGLVTDRLDGIQTRWEDRLQPGLSDDADPAVVVVAIDRATIATLGTGWPVPREVHAALIRTIAEGDPAVIAYDVLFAEPREGDEALAEAMSAAPVVLASALTLRTGDGASVAVDRVAPAPELAAAAAAVGHANVTLAADTGVVRSMPVYAVDERGVPIPSLALAAVAVADGNAAASVERPAGVQVGDRLVPAPDGELTINWSARLGVGAQEEVVAVDLLNGAVDPGVFRDRIVIVGVTEPTLGDQHLVPTDRSGSTPGLSVLANAANTIATDSYLSRPSRWSEIALVVVVGALAGLAFGLRRLTIAGLVVLVLVGGTLWFETWRFHAAGERWNVVWPVVTAALVAGSSSGWRYLDEIRHRRRAWSLVATYVPASVVEELADPTRLDDAVSSRRSTVTVLFCDLRGFTPIAARLDPDDVRRLLDRYYDYAVGIIHDHGGTVMQFVGDEVFAVFGAPIDHDDAPASALRCAAALQDDIGALHDALDENGLPRVEFGIGVHRGPVTTAHVGTIDRRQYSAIGDTVNVGSRLCGVAGAGELVVSAIAAQHLGSACSSRLEPAEDVELKGVAGRVPILRLRASHHDPVS